MEIKELMTMMTNMENIPSDPFSSLPDDVDHKTSLGFMELLGYQDYFYSSSSIFDMNMTTTSYHQLPPPPSSMEMEKSTSAHDHLLTTVDEVEQESSVVLNGQPSSPNSCSISSPAHHQQCIKEKKGVNVTKTKKKKKDKEPRFAFMTRTEVDHLDDGYRWRKYGQKAVKNSHFPRSYYKCTSASCNVKKRVERCMGDPYYIITTYEGKHNHPVAHNSPPLINPSFTTTPHAMLKLEQGGFFQDSNPCIFNV